MRRVVQTSLTLIAVLGLVAPAFAQAPPPPAEFFNEFDYAPTQPTPGPTNFEIVFAGNVTCQIPPQNQTDTATDPFTNPNPITIVYDNAPNTTTVTYSGSALTPGKQYHFGLNQGFAPNPPLQIVSKTWTYANNAPSPLPVVSVAGPAVPPGASAKYAIIYVEASFAPPGQGVVYGSWYEVPYIPEGREQPELSFYNYIKGQIIYITNSGIQWFLSIPASKTQCIQSPDCKINTQLLNRLNPKDEPPPGQPNSKFKPIVPAPPSILQPISATPTQFTCQ